MNVASIPNLVGSHEIYHGAYVVNVAFITNLVGSREIYHGAYVVNVAFIPNLVGSHEIHIIMYTHDRDNRHTTHRVEM